MTDGVGAIRFAALREKPKSSLSRKAQYTLAKQLRAERDARLNQDAAKVAAQPKPDVRTLIPSLFEKMRAGFVGMTAGDQTLWGNFKVPEGRGLGDYLRVGDSRSDDQRVTAYYRPEREGDTVPEERVELYHTKPDYSGARDGDYTTTFLKPDGTLSTISGRPTSWSEINVTTDPQPEETARSIKAVAKELGIPVPTATPIEKTAKTSREGVLKFLHRQLAGETRFNRKSS